MFDIKEEKIVPVNNFSVMSGRSHRFLGITSTFRGVNVSLLKDTTRRRYVSYPSHSTKMKEFGRKKSKKNNTAYFNAFSFKTQHTNMKEFGRKKSKKKITQLILIHFHLKLNSNHLSTIIHSFRQENFNNNNFRFILMVAHVKNVILYHNNEQYFLNKS